jgi:hypothetical protein
MTLFEGPVLLCIVQANIQYELPSIFRLPTGGFYAACWKTKNRGKLKQQQQR